MCGAMGRAWTCDFWPASINGQKSTQKLILFQKRHKRARRRVEEEKSDESWLNLIFVAGKLPNLDTSFCNPVRLAIRPRFRS